MMKITERQRIFAREYVACGVGSEAYRRAYPRSKAWTALSVEKRASRVLAQVLPLVESLRAKADGDKVMTKQRALELVSEIAGRTAESEPRTALAAVERLAKMQTWDSPTQVAVGDATEMMAVQAALDAMTPEERIAWLNRATE